jgi:hypothetical protein
LTSSLARIRVTGTRCSRSGHIGTKEVVLLADLADVEPRPHVQTVGVEGVSAVVEDGALDGFAETEVTLFEA